MIAARTNIPLAQLAKATNNACWTGRRLAKAHIGQADAIASDQSDQTRRAQTGRSAAPLGDFLFAGHRVGKTELALALTEALFDAKTPSSGWIVRIYGKASVGAFETARRRGMSLRKRRTIDLATSPPPYSVVRWTK
jgi:hypothetical protein